MRHPVKGLCGRCNQRRFLKGDLEFDALLLHGHRNQKGSFIGGAGAIEQSQMRLHIPLCRQCYRVLSSKGPPQIHLSSRGLTVRLTRKQTEAWARKREKEQAEIDREMEGY